ncbi:MAG: PP2C family protein-serine/threonine phosphatase [Phototrophicaceae bacterium]
MNLLKRLFGPKTNLPTVGSDVDSNIQHPQMNQQNLSMEDETLPAAPLPAFTQSAETQKLPMEDLIATKNARLHFGQSTDIGMVRSENQDSMLSLYITGTSTENVPDFGIFVVADGMGGHLNGAQASAMVCSIVCQQGLENIYLPLLKRSGIDKSKTPPISEILIDTIQEVNQVIIDELPDSGTTATLCLVIGNLAYFSHVGDSRAYLINNNTIDQLTRDHSLVSRLVEVGQLTPEEAKTYPRKNELYRAVGQSQMLEVDAVTRRIPANSYILMCSDGLWGLVDEPTILNIVLTSPTPQSACDKLVAVANNLGGTDNITVILIHFPS